MATIEKLMTGRTMLLVTHGAYPRAWNVVNLNRGRFVRTTQAQVGAVGANLRPVTTS
jgi:hypothetical protein